MSMTAEEKRIARNEASRRWYAKHRAAIAKTAVPDQKDEDPAPDADDLAADTKNANNVDDVQERTVMQSDDNNSFEEDDDVEINEDESEDESEDEDEDEDEVDEWAAGREDMFREFGAQGYMDED